MKNIALTIGDPTGIGPEITAKTLARGGEFPNTHLHIVGNINSLKDSAERLGIALPHDPITLHDVSGDKPGAIAYSAIEYATQMIVDGKASALITGPISKKNLMEAGHNFHGHTEILEHLAHTMFSKPDARAEMLFEYKNFRLLLLTRHIALADVPAALAKPGAVAKPLKTLIAHLRHTLKVEEPRIAILSPNPHAGEVGGEEEKKYIMPVIHAVNAIGASTLDGPFAADAFFRGFDAATTPYHAVVAAYHDQGLIPFKLLAGYEAVNVTIGLPFIRTSVSHGTAEDIAGQGIAREDSMIAALHTVIRMAA